MKAVKILSAGVLFAVASLWSGCGESDELLCDLVVTPYVQQEKGGPESVNKSVRGYFFNADTMQYKVSSYDEAASGKITSKKDGSVKTADGVGVMNTDGVITFPSLTQPMQMVVMYDPVTQIYCYRQLPLEPGVERLINTVRFRVWRSGERYKEAGWIVVNPPAQPE